MLPSLLICVNQQKAQTGLVSWAETAKPPSPAAAPADLRAAAAANLRAGHLPAVISPDN